MSLPIDIVLVRHGESEGNLVNKRDRAGDDSLMTSEHRNRHASEWRLTKQGVSQAKAAGVWLRKNFGGQFDCYLTSSFVRAMETAGHLAMPEASWEIDPYLAERDMGDLNAMPRAEAVKRFGESLAKRALQEFYWRPPNGETRTDAGLRWDRVAQAISQRYSDGRVLIVAHETLIEAAMIRRLHWTVQEFCEWKEKNDTKSKIHNCQIIHFSRRDPQTGKILSKIRWYRSVCPWNVKLTGEKWQEIKPKDFSNKDLLTLAAKYKKIVKG